MNETATMTVVDFLRACLAMDEVAAAACPHQEWQASGPPHGRQMLQGLSGTQPVTMRVRNGDGEWSESVSQGSRWSHLAEQVSYHDPGGHSLTHAARHDPAAVRADIAAKRRILDEYTESASRTVAHGAPSNAEIRTNALADVIQILAEAYADRPGYREEWRHHD